MKVLNSTKEIVMKRLTFCAALLALGGSLLSPIPAAQAAPGDLDTTFSGDGKVTSSLGTGRAVATVGNLTYVLSGDSAMYVTRYLDNGTIDTTFGTAGTTTINFGTTGDSVVPAGISVQEDGLCYVGGTALGPSYPGGDFAMARLTYTGAFDTTFSGDGKNTYGFGTSSSDTLSAIERTMIVGSGKVIASGYSDGKGAILRVNYNGSLDTSFSGDGKVTTTHTGTVSNIYGYSGLGFGYEDRITVCGTWNNDFLVARYLSNGTLDPTFGTGGVVTADITGSGSQDTAKALALDIDDNVIVVGSTGAGDAAAFAVMKFSTYSGTPSPSFSGDGKTITQFTTTGADGAQAVQIDANGKYVVAGFRTGDFAVIRYNPDGTLDSTFSGDGKVIVSFAGTEFCRSVSIRSTDGKIVLGGESNGGAATFTAVARLEGNVPASAMKASTSGANS
jgi:uncharacterized delta-60 repeat protein